MLIVQGLHEQGPLATVDNQSEADALCQLAVLREFHIDMFMRAG